MSRAWIVAAAITASLAGSELRAQADGLVAFPDAYKVQFENQWVRLVRVRIAAGSYLGMHAHPDGFMFHLPALLIIVTDGTIADATGGQSQAVIAGHERFLAAGTHTVIRNAGTAPLQVLRFDFLTPPAE